MQRVVVALLLCLSFALSIPAQTESFWTTSTVPANATGNDNSSVEVGLRFSSNMAGNVTGARVYCATNSSGTHTVHLWNSKGTSLGTATLPACSGWTAVNFASSVAITAGTTYTISYHTTEYPWNTEFFTGAVTSGNLTAPANAGVYVYGKSPAYPSSTWEASNYWVDVLFTPTTGTPTYTISGTISGVGNANVALSGAASGSTVASSAGAYSFNGLANGSYTVTPTLTGYTFNPTSQNVTINSANVSVPVFTATAVATTYTISGTISPSAAGSGATVTLSGTASATTMANTSGNYSFTGLQNGSYTVTPSNSGYTFTPQNVTVSGANLTGVNFTGQSVATTWSISGTISPSAAGSGATVTLSGTASATTMANTSGNYSFTGLQNGSYTVTPSNSGYTFTPQNVTVSGANLTGVNFTGQSVATTWSISGTISPSAAGSGATVTLSGTASATTMANTSGNYSFTGLQNGSYTVTPSNSGYTFTPQNVTVSGANLTGVNFTGQSTATTWSISGTISPSAADGTTTVTLTGPVTATTTANASGNYTFTGLANGIYSVSPTSPSYGFSPAGETLSVNGANITGVNFSGSAQSAKTITISGTISGGSGATVTLGGAGSAIAIASTSGAYSFTGLTNGTYTITPSNQGYSFAPPAQSVVVNGGNPAAVNFTAAAGYMITGTLSPAEYSVGAIVTLSGPVNATTTVTGSSTYAFTGLPAGSYTVTPSLTSATFTPTSQNVTISAANVAVPSFSATSSENVIFFDNFLQPTLSSAWTVISRHGEYSQNETECNIPQQVVTGSGLTIFATPATWLCGDFNENGTVLDAAQNWPYITGDVQWTSQNFTYGTVQIRGKFPPRSSGLWPAFWLIGANCQGTNPYTATTGYMSCPGLSSSNYVEIDMTECYESNWCQLAMAEYENTGSGGSGWPECIYPVDTNFHTFTLTWTSTSVSLTLDGNSTGCTYKSGVWTIPSTAMYLIMQIQTGGISGSPNNSLLPAELVVDYVKVTQP